MMNKWCSPRKWLDMVEIVKRIEYLKDLLYCFTVNWDKFEDVWSKGTLACTHIHDSELNGKIIRKKLRKIDVVLWLAWIAEWTVANIYVPSLTFSVNQPYSTSNRKNTRCHILSCRQFESWIRFYTPFEEW